MSEQGCFSCGKSTEIGLKILDDFLCNECEETIVKTNVEQADYEKWVRTFRKIWGDLLISTYLEK